MKNKLKSILIIVAIAIVFVIFFMIPTLIIPVSDDLLERINPQEMQSFFPLLMLYSLYMSVTYFLLLRNTEQKRSILFIQLLLAHFIMYPLMGLLESLFWGEAFKAVDINEFIRIFLRFLITFSLFTGFLSLLSKKISSNDHVPKQLINYPQLAAKIFVIGLIYFIVYNLFGYFIAWQFEATRVFYTGVIEKLDFFEAMWQNISNPAFVFVHIFRGILFGFAGYMFHKILKCSRSKKALIMALIFGGFGFQIV
ncbi:MAG: hypothetical protein KJ615_02650, partial [Bacteroidetes bacterium]|nr:hypothetical protein [Bacteroidota bacterium]